MIRYLKGILILLISAVAGYLLTVQATPYVILLAIKKGSGTTMNSPVYADIITDDHRQVVMPNPDFLYVACGYDIRKAPLRITGTMPEDSYCSVALYAANTLNFYIRNDRQTPGKEVDILLVKQGDEARYADTHPKVVASPSSVGFMLVRILVRDTSEVGYLKGVQGSWKVESAK